jgi:hypothetical protein
MDGIITERRRSPQLAAVMQKVAAAGESGIVAKHDDGAALVLNLHKDNFIVKERIGEVEKIPEGYR